MEQLTSTIKVETSNEEELIKYLPENIYFGFAEGLDKQSEKDAKNFIANYIKDNFKSKRDSFYKITKIKNHEHLPDGFLYEIQESGRGVSFSNIIIEKLREDENDFLLLKIKDKYAFIVRKLGGVETNYISTPKLTEKQSEKLLDYDKVKFVESVKKPDMRVMFSDKYTFFIISQLILITSIIMLSIVSIVRFGYYELEKPMDNYQDYSMLPIMEVSYLESTVDSRIVSIYYNRGWYMKKETINEQGDPVVEDLLLSNISQIKVEEDMNALEE